MIPVPAGVRVWLATGHTDMRRGFPSLALLVQEMLSADPHGGHLFVFRGKRGDLVKIIWHDGQGACLFSKKLERGRFIWPTPAEGAVTISRRSLAICWRASIGEPRRKPIGQRLQVEVCPLRLCPWILTGRHSRRSAKHLS